jgi:ferredoxin
MEQKPWVDKDECISCGICKNNCPQVFRLDGRGKAECYNPDGASDEEIRMVMELCPVSCVIWIDRTDKAA